MKRIIYLAALLVALAGGIVPIDASPAAAAVPPPSCPNSTFCGYGAIAYGGSLGYEYIPVRPAGTCEYAALNNQWSSMFNGSGRSVRAFDSSNCTGGYITVANGREVQTITISYPGWGDRISSIQFR
jgi:hypothetical protein